MPHIAGITTKKDVRGEITHVTFNIKKHKETMMPILEKLGIVEKSKFMEGWDAT